MLLCCNDCRGRQTIIWTQNKMSRVAANLWLHLWRCLCECDHRRSSTPSVPTTSWRSETAAQRRVRCSAVSAATTNPTTLRAAPTSCGWSSCLTALSTKLGLQPTFSKVRLSVSWRVLCFLTLVTPLCRFFFFFFCFARSGRVLQSWQRSLWAALCEHTGQLQMCLWPWVWAGSW